MLKTLLFFYPLPTTAYVGSVDYVAQVLGYATAYVFGYVRVLNLLKLGMTDHNCFQKAKLTKLSQAILGKK